MWAVLQWIREFDSCQGKQASNAIPMWSEREGEAFSQPQEKDGAHTANQGTVKLPVSISLVKLIVKYCTQENPDLRATPPPQQGVICFLSFSLLTFDPPPPCREVCSSWYPIHLLKTSPPVKRLLYFLLWLRCLPFSRTGIWPSSTHRVCCTKSRWFFLKL